MDDKQNQPTLLSCIEASKLVGVSAKTFKHKIGPRLKTYTIGSRTKYNRADVIEYMNKATEPALKG
jgi:hypothetical protein